MTDAKSHALSRIHAVSLPNVLPFNIDPFAIVPTVGLAILKYTVINVSVRVIDEFMRPS